MKLTQKLRQFFNGRRNHKEVQENIPECKPDDYEIGIVTTKHSMYVAKLIDAELKRAGYTTGLFDHEIETLKNAPYIYIAPVFIRKFPENYIVFQMEQTVSSRWFTPEYIEALNRAHAVMDYSLSNIECFKDPREMRFSGFGKNVFYVPVDYLPGYRTDTVHNEKIYDVLFYGDTECERRKAYLSELQKHFKVKVCYNVFDEELYREIEKTKIVVNIHYYENALLETTRIYETLSLNSALIVSEDSHDTAEKKRLSPYVDFVPENDIDAMVDRIRYWLSHDEQRKERTEKVWKLLCEKPNEFSERFRMFMDENGSFLNLNRKSAKIL